MKISWKLPLYIAGGLLALWLGAKFALPVVLPFLFGLGLARLGKGPVGFLQRKSGLPRALCSLLVITLICALLGLVLWLTGRLLFSRLEQLGQRLPELEPLLSDALSQLYDRLVRFAQRLPKALSAALLPWLERLFTGSGAVMDALSTRLMGLAGSLISHMPDFFLFLLTAFLSAYLFSSQAEALKKSVKKWFTEEFLLRFAALRKRLKTALGGYFKVQLYLLLITFGVLLGGFFLLGRERPLLLAVLISLLDALPFFGAGIVLIPWSLLSFFQGRLLPAVGLLLLYGLCAVLRAFLEPRLLGKQMGLHPLLALLALYGGFRLFGIVGMLLLPIAVVLLKQALELVEQP